MPEDVVEGPIVRGTVQRQHVIAIGHRPPGARAVAAHVTDEFMGRLNPATAQRIAPLPLGAPLWVLVMAGSIFSHGDQELH